MVTIKIKIKDKEWFRRNCDVIMDMYGDVLAPSCWTREQQNKAVRYGCAGLMWEKLTA